MTWQQLESEGKVRPHVTSAQEIANLRDVVSRDLEDAQIPELSADRRFATAYNAALQTAKVVTALSGYRTSGLGAHQTAFQAIKVAMGPEVHPLMNYFDACRRKRNSVDYDLAGIATETETTSLLEKAEEFRALAEAWITANHPQFALTEPPTIS
jgi:hypothetical protein